MFTKAKVSLAVVAAAAMVGLGAMATNAQASAIPADAIYGDSFPSPGIRGTTLVGKTPEIDHSGQSAAYSGNSDASKYQVDTLSVSNGINDGSSGVLRYTDHSNADSGLLLPLTDSMKSNGYVVQVDVIPFPGASRSAVPFAGLMLTDGATNNYYTKNSNSVHFGIAGKQVTPNSQESYTNSWSLLASDRATGKLSSSIDANTLDSFSADNWNHLELIVKPSEGVTVFFNGQQIGQYDASQFQDLGGLDYVGLEAISGHTNLNTSSGPYPAMDDNDQSAYFDNFSVSPIPEPAALSLLGMGGLLLLRKRRH